jgi:hypothetical protein
MKTTINPLSCSVLFILLLFLPLLGAGKISEKKFELHRLSAAAAAADKKPAQLCEDEACSLYTEIDLKSFGLSEKAFECAYKGYKYLINHHFLTRSDVISICDFSQSSRNKRLYVVNIDQKKVLINTYVAHGRRSGSEYARSFSNNPDSHKSSLGFYITEETYYGDHGLALKIHGLERGFNDKADRRNIVIHGSDYVGPDFLRQNKFNGRSFGCPAVPASDIAEVIQTIKNGSCLFIYYPTKKYITKSKILNG